MSMRVWTIFFLSIKSVINTNLYDEGKKENIRKYFILFHETNKYVFCRALYLLIPFYERLPK